MNVVDGVITLQYNILCKAARIYIHTYIGMRYPYVIPLQWSLVIGLCISMTMNMVLYEKRVRKHEIIITKCEDEHKKTPLPLTPVICPKTECAAVVVCDDEPSPPIVASLANDLLICVVTARRGGENYLKVLTDGLEVQGANFMVIDTDNSTFGSGVQLQTPDVACVPGYVECPQQKQGNDLVKGIQRCVGGERRTKWVALVEDDMVICDGSMKTIQTVLASLGHFKTARFAKYSRATVFEVENVNKYHDFVLAHIHETPYDLLLSHPWADGQEDYIHPVSLFAHAGKVSTIKERNDPVYIAMYSSIRDEACGSALYA